MLTKVFVTQLIFSSYAKTERLEIQWNVPDRYEIIRRVGGGKYSEVRLSIPLSVVHLM